MHLTETFEIDASVDQVLTALADPAYHAERAARRGATMTTPTLTAAPDVTVDARWQLPTTGLDAMARRMVGDTLVLHEQQRWTRSGDTATGTHRVSVEGLKVEVDAAGRLEPLGPTRCRCTLDGTLTARVPLVGTAIERQAAPVIGAFLRDEAAGLGAWAAAH